MQRRKSARNQKPEPTPAQESPAPAKDTAKGKRKDTPVKEKQADTPPAPPPPPPLPTKLATGQPIPTVKEPQPASLPESDWHNVLKAALERSRQKWMTPGIFELYYSKAGKKKLPNKGKNKEEDKDKEKDKNKTKEGGGDGAKEKEPSETLKAKQMKREGNCKLYIDPHQWDITLWTMRENTVPPPPKPKPAPPPPSYNHQQGYYYGAGYSATPPYQHYHPYPPQHPQHPQHPPHPAPIRKPPPPAAPNPPPPSRPAQAPESNPAASKPAPDPVIHMLAERANTNFKLRDIMKIVARGDATKEQLEYFQSHINELTERLEAQKKAQQTQKPTPRPAPPPSTHAGPTPSPVPASPSPAPAHDSQASPTVQASPVPRPPPPPPPQPTYRALCIDFNTNGDRLLFPRETILEALPGNQVLASFLKVHKVDQATLSQLPKTQTYYSPGKEYYQPITVRFRATSPADTHSTGVLQCLFRWVRPQEEVRKFMEEVMDRAEPAEDVELAARLPREGFVQEGTSMLIGVEGSNGVAREEKGGGGGKGKDAVAAVKESVERVGTPVGERDRKRKRAR
ncbi:hypothetical protein SLS55_001564 [Diplodia seriata]|uniref:SWR1-complex protein 3 domain-containing protein n=1 Tax=Diplodia seriata TaxID=420778 RepID=A0ABR3CSC1_9PEZI